MRARQYEAARRDLDQRRLQVLRRYRDAQARSDEELATREIELMDNAAELWDAQLLSTLSDADVRLLADIYAALERIDDGRYGTCTACGRPIDPARLAAIPHTARCIDCASLALD